jgi:hypothetical protein
MVVAAADITEVLLLGWRHHIERAPVATLMGSAALQMKLDGCGQISGFWKLKLAICV